jgi:chromosome segregation ATPase
MESDDDSISLSMEEYSRIQTDMLTLKHENVRLKEISDKHEELVKAFSQCQDELHRLQSQEDPLKKVTKFSRDVILNCLKSVRKQDEFDKDQQLIIEQLLATVEYLWPKSGTQEVKTTEIHDLGLQTELKLCKESSQRMKNTIEEMEEKSKAMKASIEETAKENLRMSHKIGELESKKEHLIVDLASREEELVEARKMVKDKYAVECKAKDLEIEIERLNALIEKQKNEAENNSPAKVDAGKCKDLEAEIEELRNNENMLNLEYQNLKTSAKQTISELNSTKNKLKDQEAVIKRLEETVKKAQLEIEDMKTERQILQKRTMHDLKDLKSELAKEKNMHEQCKMDKERVIQENRKLMDNLRAGVKLPPPTQQEKVLVESMSYKISELEGENFGLREKIKEISEFEEHNIALEKENEELKAEIGRLSMDIAMMGAQFNEYIRSVKKT